MYATIITSQKIYYNFYQNFQTLGQFFFPHRNLYVRVNNFFKINIQFDHEFLAKTMKNISKKKKKKLKPALKVTLVTPYTSNRRRKVAKFSRQLCQNRMKNYEDYTVEEMMDIFMRYVHLETLGNRRKYILPTAFRKLFKYYEEWFESFLFANEKLKK